MLEVVFQGSKCRIETVLLRFSWSYSHSTGFFIPFRGSGSGAKSVPLFGGDTAELNIASVRILSSWTPKKSFMIGQSYKWPFYPCGLVMKESTQIDSKEKKNLEQESFLPKHSWNALKCYIPFQPLNLLPDAPGDPVFPVQPKVYRLEDILSFLVVKNGLAATMAGALFREGWEEQFRGRAL